MKILGKLSPDFVSQVLGTGFKQFESPTGIHGLAKLTKRDRLEVLAVLATNPGAGQFRAFIEGAKAEACSITFLSIMNPLLAATLKRYGFKKVRLGDRGDGMRWLKETV